MTVPPIDPSFATAGVEWSVPNLDGTQPGVEAAAGGADGTTGAGFGDMLAQSIGRLDELQVEAAEASRDLATGQATDPTSVVMAIERAQLAMQLASTVRTKAVDAINDVFHTTV